jgi:hypothetical protein
MSDIAYRQLRARHLHEYAAFLANVDLHNDSQFRDVLRSMELYGIEIQEIAKKWRLARTTVNRWISTASLPSILGRQELLDWIRLQVLAQVSDHANED